MGEARNHCSGHEDSPPSLCPISPPRFLIPQRLLRTKNLFLSVYVGEARNHCSGHEDSPPSLCPISPPRFIIPQRLLRTKNLFLSVYCEPKTCKRSFSLHNLRVCGGSQESLLRTRRQSPFVMSNQSPSFPNSTWDGLPNSGTKTELGTKIDSKLVSWELKPIASHRLNVYCEPKTCKRSFSLHNLRVCGGRPRTIAQDTKTVPLRYVQSVPLVS